MEIKPIDAYNWVCTDNRKIRFQYYSNKAESPYECGQGWYVYGLTGVCNGPHRTMEKAKGWAEAKMRKVEK